MILFSWPTSGNISFPFMVATVIFLLVYYFAWARTRFQGPRVQGAEAELTELEREFDQAAGQTAGPPPRRTSGVVAPRGGAPTRSIGGSAGSPVGPFRPSDPSVPTAAPSEEPTMSSDSHGHPKHARLEELEGMVRDGRIDTLVVAITDMQGRLMGKRVQGQAFLDGVIDHGAHFCTYLLGTDMEMNTPEGFRLMNWETGYGDWIATPVWDTLRVLPWLEKTAIVLSDTIDRGDPRGDRRLAADDPQAPGRRGHEAGLRHQGRLGVRVLRPA